MTIKDLPIKSLNEAKYNPRVITKEEFEGLKASIKAFGFVDPVIINKDLTIIGGHQRVRAAKDLGFDEVPCNILDLDKHQEKKLNIILNSQALSGKYDENMLAEILEELKLDDDYTDLRLDQLESIDLSEKANDDEDINNYMIFRVYVDCTNEEEQERIFNDVQKLGYDPKIVQL